jgi:putative N6-adenine-specific DNA methylase
MDLFNLHRKIIITCHKWLAPSLEKEVTDLGFTTERVFQTGVELAGTLHDCIKLNLNLRCASQVMFSLKTFICNDPDELHKIVSTIQWEKIIARNGYFSVTSNVFHPTIQTNLFANLRVKDAIVDRMRFANNIRPTTGSDLIGTVVYLYWKNEEAEIFIDTSGETLAKHNYRKLPGTAPMLEALAAATIISTRWDKRSLFINPMCGSGTLAIEAALIATNRAPGLLRNNYAFKHILGFERDMYEKEKLLLSEKIQEPKELKIIASDISEKAIKIARINAEAAEVDHLIEFHECDFEDTPIQDGDGIVMFNPEYGERLGDEVELNQTYARIGDFMKNNCKGKLGYVFTGNLDLAKSIRLKPSRRIEFLNAKIDCRLLEYELYAGTRRVDKPNQ